MNNREIDRLIAEKVFGFEVEDHCIICDRMRSFLPLYSQKIELAWKVVEKLSENSDFELSKDCDDSFYMCEFLFTLNKVFVAKAETAPLAICLAALESVGVEVNHNGSSCI